MASSGLGPMVSDYKSNAISTPAGTWENQTTKSVEKWLSSKYICTQKGDLCCRDRRQLGSHPLKVVAVFPLC